MRTIGLDPDRAADVLPTLKNDSADAAFLDAAKSSLPVYTAEAKRIVRPGGLVMVDNAFAFGQLLDDHPSDREVPDLRAFNDAMALDPDLDGVIVGMGDGVWVAVNGGAS